MHQIEDYNAEFTHIELTKKLTEKEVDKLVAAILAKEKELTSSNIILLLIDASAIAGINHLKACILNALHAFQQQTNITKTVNVEILLYISGYRQISRAIEEVGVNTKTTNLLAIQLIPKSKFQDNSFTNLNLLLNELNIQMNLILEDVNEIPLINEQKIIQLLEITPTEIDLYRNDNTDLSRKLAIERIAIEKSALLNLIK